ncbi:MAG TPA: PRC-barrel domain-containing protein [Vicinamibacterales bacterium]|nr:PRC-barrel domain-containing protein [Vicinamibacterales bacterium]
MPASTFKYIAAAGVAIEGVPTEGMTIRAATGRALGRLGGFIVDAAEQHIRYFVVRRPGLFGKTGVLPFSIPRVDLDGRAIEIDVNDQELRQLRNLSPDALIA